MAKVVLKMYLKNAVKTRICRSLSEEEKSGEILRLLPLLTPFAQNFSALKVSK
jgi:hypothetical protein